MAGTSLAAARRVCGQNILAGDILAGFGRHFGRHVSRSSPARSWPKILIPWPKIIEWPKFSPRGQNAWPKWKEIVAKMINLRGQNGPKLKKLVAKMLAKIIICVAKITENHEKPRKAKENQRKPRKTKKNQGKPRQMKENQ